MENKNNGNLDEKGILYANDYPKPIIGNLITGLVFIILCFINIPSIKFSEYIIIKILAFIAICLGAFAAVGYFRIVWNDFDFNREAKKFLNEKDR